MLESYGTTPESRCIDYAARCIHEALKAGDTVGNEYYWALAYGWFRRAEHIMKGGR